MNDYKELIERLRDLKKATRDGWTIERLQVVMRMDCLDAADAIEQLVKERDAAVDDLKKNRVCTVCVFGNDDTLFPCEDCCAYTDNYFEWRGVQEDNDEID